MDVKVGIRDCETSLSTQTLFLGVIGGTYHARDTQKKNLYEYVSSNCVE